MSSGNQADEEAQKIVLYKSHDNRRLRLVVRDFAIQIVPMPSLYPFSMSTTLWMKDENGSYRQLFDEEFEYDEMYQPMLEFRDKETLISHILAVLEKYSKKEDSPTPPLHGLLDIF